jgi:hypothetical protein
MTPEQSLDRLERIARLMVRAGLRARHNAREQDARINIMIDAQIKNDERFAQQRAHHDETIGVMQDKIGFVLDAQIGNEERFAKLAESQSQTDRRLDALIDIIREGRNGKSR